MAFLELLNGRLPGHPEGLSKVAWERGLVSHGLDPSKVTRTAFQLVSFPGNDAA